MRKSKQCVLCPYKNEEDCLSHEKCYSLSNIYYGTIIKIFPFKQIHNFLTWRAWEKEGKYIEQMDKKYGNSLYETDELKFIWGVKNWFDLSGGDANLWTMNEIDITYDKEKQKYMLGVETAYVFSSYADECNYLRDCLEAFTKYMDDNGLKKNEPYTLFMSDLSINLEADTIEELYTNFKIFVDGFCNQNIDAEDFK